MIFAINVNCSKSKSIIKLFMNSRALGTGFVFAITVLTTLLLRTHSLSSTRGMVPTKRYINIAIIKLDSAVSTQIDQSTNMFNYVYVLPSAKTDNNYQAAVTTSTISSSFAANRILHYRLYVNAMTNTNITIALNTLVPQIFTLLQTQPQLQSQLIRCSQEKGSVKLIFGQDESSKYVNKFICPQGMNRHTFISSKQRSPKCRYCSNHLCMF